MGRRLLLGAVMCAILLVAATTRSDVAPSGDVAVDDTASLPEPIGETAVLPAAGVETLQKDPFAPYNIGPPESVWPYEAMTPEEQAVIDRGRDTGSWQQTHDDYATAVRDRSHAARAEAAQHLLGIEGSLGATGVIP